MAHSERRGVELCKVPVHNLLSRVDRIEHRQLRVDLKLSLDPLHLWRTRSGIADGWRG